jgi:hypothetical protein
MEYLNYGPNGAPWPNIPAVTKRVNYVYAGAPFAFTCKPTEYPVVDKAQRYIWGCKQELSALLRYPCKGGNSSFGGCTSDDYVVK